MTRHAVSAPPARPRRFDARTLAGLDEPVRRYLAHALVDGTALHERIELRMAGRIKAGVRLRFSATQRMTEGGYEWRARAGLGPVRPLHVVDRYADGAGSTDGRVFGRLRFLHAEDEDTLRSAAGRAAVEYMWLPARLLPDRGVDWRALAPDHIVATLDVAPERPEVHLRLDALGGVRSVWLMRWGNVGTAEYGAIPFGAEISAERRFGDVVIPSRVRVGWWYGTPRWAPFFEAGVLDVRPLD